MTVDSPIGLLGLVVTGDALTELRMDATPRTETGSATERKLMDDAVAQVEAYFDGSLKDFELPLRSSGTAFQTAVWHELERIPYGTVTSYVEIARRVGKPTASRAVGAANGRNPIAIVVPCHRVIGADGSLTGYGGGLWRKEWLLNHEGHAFAGA
jgi:methylated-DNA-[protein]-cysteine S-methyltransferase